MIKQLRTDLADLVSQVISTEACWPEAFDLPGGLLKAGTPFIEKSPFGGLMKVRFEIWIVTNDDRKLDEYIVGVAGLLNDEDYDIENIAVEPRESGGYLAGARIILTQEVERNDLYGKN